jgi:hypothetical protein|tara:strand:+ start:269 stop:559 length:291 start_codon:yes stop_codon:yes gene_type:complete
MKLSKQQKRILDYVDTNIVLNEDDDYYAHGVINALSSWNNCGVYRLSAVIHELRKKGFDILTRDKKVKNQFGEVCTVGEYIFIGNEQYISYQQNWN